MIDKILTLCRMELKQTNTTVARQVEVESQLPDHPSQIPHTKLPHRALKNRSRCTQRSFDT